MNGFVQQSSTINMQLRLPTFKFEQSTGPSGVPTMTCDQIASLHPAKK